MIDLNKGLKEFIGFLGVGVTNTILTYFIYLLLLFVIHYQLAYLFSYILGIFITYYLNLKFVFKKKSNKEKILKFPLVYIFQYIVGAILMNIIVNKLDINKSFAPILIILFMLPITFF
jgi:GtrA-like protein.